MDFWTLPRFLIIGSSGPECQANVGKKTIHISESVGHVLDTLTSLFFLDLFDTPSLKAKTHLGVLFGGSEPGGPRDSCESIAWTATVPT